jgi:hypothetical protein
MPRDQSMTDNWLTDEINRACYKLETDTYLSYRNREILKTSLEELIDKRTRLRETMRKKSDEPGDNQSDH